jgi:hypothetical protein
MSGLADRALPPPDERQGRRPGPDAQMPQAQPRMPPPGEVTVTIYLTSGVRTSAGPGPGVKTLPAPEANALIGMKYAVYGADPPDGMGGTPEPAVKPFPAAQGRVRAAQSN